MISLGPSSDAAAYFDFLPLVFLYLVFFYFSLETLYCLYEAVACFIHFFFVVSFCLGGLDTIEQFKWATLAVSVAGSIADALGRPGLSHDLTYDKWQISVITCVPFLLVGRQFLCRVITIFLEAEVNFEGLQG